MVPMYTGDESLKTAHLGSTPARFQVRDAAPSRPKTSEGEREHDLQTAQPDRRADGEPFAFAEARREETSIRGPRIARRLLPNEYAKTIECLCRLRAES